jgi:hypothetical protein
VARLECARLANESLVWFGKAFVGEDLSSSGTGHILDELRREFGLIGTLHRGNPRRNRRVGRLGEGEPRDGAAGVERLGLENQTGIGFAARNVLEDIAIRRVDDLRMKPNPRPIFDLLGRRCAGAGIPSHSHPHIRTRQICK